MKKNLFFLLCFALAATACKDDDKNGGGDNQWFRKPVASVDGTTVTVKCLTLFGKGVLAVSPSGFVYTPIEAGGSFGEPVTVSDPQIDESILSCRLSGLAPHSLYMIYAFVEVDGSRKQSEPLIFETGYDSEEPDPEPDPGPGPDPEPEPEPEPDLVLSGYTGWSELPEQQFKTGDYHFVRHYCPGMTGEAGRALRNYTICYSADLRCPVWVAYPLHKVYAAGDVGRSSWKNDPDIPRNVQPDLTSGSYLPQPGYSRGHMIASNDRQVSKAVNQQTFYVTNSAPQIQDRFNGSIWALLEQQCWKNTPSDTLFVVTGAYFADTSTTTDDQSHHEVYVPTHFYKVMIRSKDGAPRRPLRELPAEQIQCVGFWFEHRDYPTGSKPAQYMTSVAEIERKTGMKFFVNVPAAPKEEYDAADWSF